MASSSLSDYSYILNLQPDDVRLSDNQHPNYPTIVRCVFQIIHLAQTEYKGVPLDEWVAGNSEYINAHQLLAEW